jgi:hypothetical protein
MKNNRPIAALWWVVFALFLVPPVLGTILFWTGHGSHKHQLGKALLIVSVFLVVVTFFVWWAGNGNENVQRRIGPLQLILGADGRLSTSKAVVGLWTAILAMSLVFLSGMTWFAAASPGTSFNGSWDAYFLLLGGPFAAAVASKGIVTSKIAGNVAAAPPIPVKKTVNAAASASAIGGGAAGAPAEVDGTPHPRDIIANDTGDTDLVDTQYVIFTLVAIVYFVGALINNIVLYAHTASLTSIGLPAIPPALLGLTSAAALTYVGKKAVTPV